jgi:multidrug transporter EmrE-like cation transporter
MSFMNNAFTSLAPLMTETKIILMLLPVVAFCYWVCIVRKKRSFNLQELIVLVFNVVGGITGVSIFVGAFKMADSSSEHAIWSGIGGFCIALFFFDQGRVFFRSLLVCEVEPKTEKDQPQI